MNVRALFYNDETIESNTAPMLGRVEATLYKAEALFNNDNNIIPERCSNMLESKTNFHQSRSYLVERWSIYQLSERVILLSNQ